MASQKPLQGPILSPVGKLVKITMFIKKLPNVSDDYFHAYWAANHVAPAMRLKNFRDKVRRYNQYHITPETRAQAQQMGAPVLDYDGVAEIWVNTMDDWVSAVTDPALTKEIEGE